MTIFTYIERNILIIFYISFLLKINFHLSIIVIIKLNFTLIYLELEIILCIFFKGSFLECVRACENSAEKLLKLIVNDFECFRDEAIYQNQKGKIIHILII